MVWWQKIKKTLNRSAKIAGQKTGAISQRSKVKINELGIKKQIEEKFFELGGQVYQRAVKEKTLNFEQDLIIKHLIEQIKELEQELNLMEAESRPK